MLLPLYRIIELLKGNTIKFHRVACRIFKKRSALEGDLAVTTIVRLLSLFTIITLFRYVYIILLPLRLIEMALSNGNGEPHNPLKSSMSMAQAAAPAKPASDINFI